MATRSVNLIVAALLCTSLAAFSHAAQSSLDGQWEGTLVRENSEAKITLNFRTTADGIEGTMNMPSVGMFRQPLSKITINSSKIHFEQDNIVAVFDGETQG